MERITEAEAAARLRNFALFYRDGAAPYEERGTAALLLAIMALEKQAPKPARAAEVSAGRCAWSCPTCGRRHHADGMANYCNQCGQKIEWKDWRG